MSVKYTIEEMLGLDEPYVQSQEVLDYRDHLRREFAGERPKTFHEARVDLRFAIEKLHCKLIDALWWISDLFERMGGKHDD